MPRTPVFFRVACNIIQVVCNIYEKEHCSISYRVACDFGISKRCVCVYWCFTSHATIFQLYMWRHRCAVGLKKKIYLRSGSQRDIHFVGFFNVPVLHRHGATFWYGYSEKPPNLVAFTTCWGYGGRILILNPGVLTKVVYLNSKKVSIMWLLQRVHGETKVSCAFVIYQIKPQRVHRALPGGRAVLGFESYRGQDFLYCSLVPYSSQLDWQRSKL